MSSSSSLLSSSMGLDDHDDHPRRFINWQGEFLLAYGGDDGTLTMCVTTGTLPTNTSKASLPSPPRRRPKWIKVRQWDDAVRAIVIAPNGKRVAVGFETGATTIYTYKDYQHIPHEPHPFFKKAWQKWQRRLQEKENQPLKDEEDDDDDFDDDDDAGLLSQSSSSHLLHNGDEEEELSFPGPQMSAPIRDLQFDPRCSNSSNYLAIACEAGFCVTNVTSSSTVLPLYLQEVGEKEHDSSGIRGLCYMTTNESKDNNNNKSSSSTSMCFLATLAMDGRLCVWNVTNCDDPDLDWELHHRDVSKCIADPDVGELNGADAADRSCRPLVVDSFLALPGQTDVLLRPVSQISNEKFLPSLDGKGHLEPIVAMTTTQGPYLITSGRDGRVNLWKLPANNHNNKEDNATGTFVAQIGHYDSIPTDVCWMAPPKEQRRPNSNAESNNSSELYIACANGTCVVVPNVNQFLPRPNVVAEEDEETTTTTKTKTTNKIPKAANSSKKEKSEHVTSPAPKKKNVYIDDEADDDEDALVHGGRGNDEQVEDDDATVDLANALKASSTAAIISHSSNRSITDEAREAAMDDGYGYDDDDDDMDGILPHDNEDVVRHGAVALRLPEPQAAFAPSSTPLDLPRRILCWNHIGVISFLRGDDDLVRNMVNIEFTDVTQRRPMSFTDNMNFILGALGDEGAIFASDLQEDDVDDDDDLDADLIDGLNISERTKAVVKKSQRQRMKKDGANKSTGSSIYFHRFETFASLRDKDWYWSLPDGERVLGCACGEGWAAVATNRQFLRFFTLGGNQGQVIWLKGELVTMVGRSRFLAVFFHESNPLMDGTQQLGYALFDAVACRVISRGSVSSISKRSALSWAGFSNDFSLMVMDTDGMLSMLISMADTNGSADAMASSPWEWTPILDTVGLRKSTEDSIWPIAVQDGKLVCVPLKGGNQYPDATRRPVTATLSLRMPLARGGAVDKIVTLEELSVRANMALSQKRVISNYLISNPVEKEEFEDEYESMCAQVDKVTLQLYRAMAEAGKLERALDLVHRLHLEKSFDIAITMADRLNHRNLSDRIEEAKERWLLSMQHPEQLDDEEDDLGGMEEIPNDEEDEDGLDNNQYGTTTELVRNVRGGKTTNVKLNTESATTNGSIRRISPDAHRTVKKRSFDQIGDEKKNKNPFAKKRLESPAHKSNLISSPPRLASPKPKISRASTFSTKSREQNKASKNFL